MKTIELAVVQIAALTAVLIGAATCVGYMLRLPSLYNWTINAAPMALNTGVCFVLLGASLYLVSRKG